MIRDAADKGMDQIAIPSGVVAARRYKMDRTIMNLMLENQYVPEEDEIELILANKYGKQYTEFYSRDEFKKLIKTKIFFKDLDNFYEGILFHQKVINIILVDQTQVIYLNLELNKSIEILDPKKKVK